LKHVSPPRLLVVGGASLDLLHFSGQTARSAGGAGLYTALAAARAGAAVTMYAPRPEPVPDELRPALGRFDWVGPTVPPEELPRFEIANLGDGRTEMRSLFWGAEARLRPADTPPVGDWVYCVPFADPALQLAFVRWAREGNRRVACGTYAPLAAAHRDLVRRSAGLADAFFCNEAEATTLFGSLEAAQVEPGRLLFVTRGPRGARVVQGSYRTDLPGTAAAELDPTGAGDTFCGTVLARLLLGDHPVEAARHGLAHAAQMIGEVGPSALLRDEPPPAPAEDPRVAIDDGRLVAVAALLRGRGDLRPFDFVGELFPPSGHPRALEFFFAATLQQFGFWRLEKDRWGGPMVASLGGRPLKGSDFLWATYRRWLEEDPEGLLPAKQAELSPPAFERRLADDGGRSPLPEGHLFLNAARSYGKDMTALRLDPAVLVARAAAAPSPLAALLTQLDHVGGYKEDPLRKKSALLGLILRERPERFLPRGAEDLPPIVDYHVQRSLLRLGIVEVHDPGLQARLESRVRLLPADEEAIRRSAGKAMSRLAGASGRGMAACDYFLFQMRHRCPETREPECALCPADSACAHRKQLFQPVFRTTFY
jgi:sugar/nucleoside kinase (ribokinase family)